MTTSPQHRPEARTRQIHHDDMFVIPNREVPMHRKQMRMANIDEAVQAATRDCAKPLVDEYSLHGNMDPVSNCAIHVPLSTLPKKLLHDITVLKLLALVPPTFRGW